MLINIILNLNIVKKLQKSSFFLLNLNFDNKNVCLLLRIIYTPIFSVAICGVVNKYLREDLLLQTIYIVLSSHECDLISRT